MLSSSGMDDGVVASSSHDSDEDMIGMDDDEGTTITGGCVVTGGNGRKSTHVIFQVTSWSVPYPSPVDWSRLNEIRLSFIPDPDKLHAPHNAVKPLMVILGKGMVAGVTVMSRGTKFALLGFS